MKIYVVTKGDYSDYHIVAATLDKEKAEKIANRFSDKWETCDIEEYEDSEIITKPYWLVRFDGKTGEITELRDESNSSYAFRNLNRVYRCSHMDLEVYVAADTSEEAIKIASEKRAEYLAKKEGVC